MITSAERAPSEATSRVVDAVPLLALLAAFVYFVLIGGTARGETDPSTRLINTVVGGALVALLVWRLRSAADRIDRWVVAAVLLFVAAGTLSAFPRQSFDAALGALVYVAALHHARGEMGSERARRLALVVLMALSVVFTVIATVFWLPPILEWWARTGWQVTPPLNLELAGWPWGHRHDLALLILMLYPAWWAGRPSVGRRLLAVIVGVLVGLIVLVDGSRSLWIAIAAASTYLAVGPALRVWRQAAHLRPYVVGGGVLLSGALIVTGIGGALIERASSLASLGFRATMWERLIDVWTANPVAGAGIGAFPWTLQLTDYFDTNSWAPRHPDNAPIQMLAEGGVVGIAALAVLVVTLVPAILRGRSSAARAALIMFTIASIGGNPTDFGFLVVVAIAWVAIAVPRDVRIQGQRTSLVLTAASFACLAMIGLAQGATVIAGFAYEQARAAVVDERMQDAVSAMDAAVALDPAMALYARQRGALHAVVGDASAAIEDLERATQTNKSDDLAWRTLALAYDAAGDPGARDAALDRAISVQRSDPTNLLLQAHWDGREGHEAASAETLVEIVQAWPTIVFAPGWEDLVSGSTTATEIIDRAFDRWLSESPGPETRGDQGLWLASMSGDRELLAMEVMSSPWSPAITEAFLRGMGCDRTMIDALDAAPSADQRSPFYWWLRVRASILIGAPDTEAAHMAGLLRSPVVAAGASGVLNPRNENGGFSADTFGYRRPPITWPSGSIELPSPGAGWVRWMLAPSSAVREAGLSERLHDC